MSKVDRIGRVVWPTVAGTSIAGLIAFGNSMKGSDIVVTVLIGAGLGAVVGAFLVIASPRRSAL